MENDIFDVSIPFHANIKLIFLFHVASFLWQFHAILNLIVGIIKEFTLIMIMGDFAEVVSVRGRILLFTHD